MKNKLKGVANQQWCWDSESKDGGEQCSKWILHWLTVYSLCFSHTVMLQSQPGNFLSSFCTSDWPPLERWGLLSLQYYETKKPFVMSGELTRILVRTNSQEVLNSHWKKWSETTAFVTTVLKGGNGLSAGEMYPRVQDTHVVRTYIWHRRLHREPEMLRLSDCV